jgi:hypothetical protein
MPTVILKEVSMTQIGQPFVPVRAKSSDRAFASSVAGSVQKYANGRFRSVTQAGVARKFDLTLKDMPAGVIVVPTTPVATSVFYITLLEQWLGTTVILRDFRGNFIYGTYFDLQIRELKSPSYVNATLSFQQLTGVVGQ